MLDLYYSIGEINIEMISALHLDGFNMCGCSEVTLDRT